MSAPSPPSPLRVGVISFVFCAALSVLGVQIATMSVPGNKSRLVSPRDHEDAEAETRPRENGRVLSTPKPLGRPSSLPVNGGEGRLDLPELSALDSEMLQSDDRRFEALRAMHFRGAEAILGRVFPARKQCPGLSQDPTALRLDVALRSGAQGLALESLRDITIESGAPVPQSGLDCLASHVRSDLPIVVNTTPTVDFVGNGFFRATVRGLAE